MKLILMNNGWLVGGVSSIYRTTTHIKDWGGKTHDIAFISRMAGSISHQCHHGKGHNGIRALSCSVRVMCDETKIG